MEQDEILTEQDGEQTETEQTEQNEQNESTQNSIDLSTLTDYEQAILTACATYFSYAGDAPSDAFLLLLIQRVVGDYKEQRSYPVTLTAEEIEADVSKYFNMRYGYVATEIIPAMLGKVGGEGLYSLVDNQVSKNWKYPFPVYLPDVVPYCEVI